MSHNYFPLLSYTEAPCTSRWAQRDQREVETRRRAWGLFSYKNEHGRNTLEVGVIVESMPDFCGGMLVYSPFVISRSEGDTWGNCFYTTDETPEEEGEIFRRWENLREGMTADLNRLMDMESVSRAEAEAYGWECLVAWVAGALLHNGKRGFVGADRLDGRMTQLVRTMQSIGAITATPMRCMGTTRLPVGRDRDSWLPDWQRAGYQYHTSVVSFDVDFGPEWYNANSGNTVRWLSGSIIGTPAACRSSDEWWVECWDCGHHYNRNDFDECPDCGDEEYGTLDDESALQPANWEAPEEVRNLDAQEYPRRARRHHWRNG